MARRKQRFPTRTKGITVSRFNSIQDQADNSKDDPNGLMNDSQNVGRTGSETYVEGEICSQPNHMNSVEIYSPVLEDDGGFDVAEVSLENATYSVSPVSTMIEVSSEGYLQARLRLLNLEQKCFGGLYTLSADDIKVEFVAQVDDLINQQLLAESIQSGCTFTVSGYLDGPDTFISGLYYLFKHGYIILKMHHQLISTLVRDGLGSCCRLQVTITNKTFENSNGLLDNTRQVWKRSMLQVMAWLRPDLHSDEAIYGIPIYHLSEHPVSTRTLGEGFDADQREESEEYCNKESVFDPSSLYEAIKPDKNEPSLGVDLPDLLPKLRPYQSRAACWMVNREKGLVSDPCVPSSTQTSLCYDNCNNGLRMGILKCPLSVRAYSIDRSSFFSYNPFSGCVSRELFEDLPDVRGGILADEMGLGKTVELIACILANPYKDSADNSRHKNIAAESASRRLHLALKKRKRERVDCPCGAVDDDGSYSGFWVQCDFCDSWQHASCVGFGLEYRDGESVGHGKSVQNHQLYSGDIGTKITKKMKFSTSESNSKLETNVGSGNENYVCGLCAEAVGSVEVEGISGATLVVCPSSILCQWQEEISRHTRKGSLKVIVYEGVQRGCSTSGDGLESNGRVKVVGAHELATADIVLTTYDTLRIDLSHDCARDEKNQRSMRFHKRYPVVPTPLTRLHWWRVCLDEAQMVESGTTGAAEMALRLNAQNRWCITGTPIQRSLDDLYGLLKFLDVQPFNDYFWWIRVLKQPYERRNVGATYFAHEYLKHLMWRTSKAQVSNELDLPPQEENITWLKFSPVEAHFYRQQHEHCAIKARELLAECKSFLGMPEVNSNMQHGEGSSLGQQSVTSRIRKENTGKVCFDRLLTHAEVAKLLNPLLRLRQACCHPQVGSAGLRSLQRSPMTMDEILKVLVERAKTEGEEAQRCVIGAMNGLAGLSILEGNLPLAISIYREALQLIEENAEDIRVDPLQKLHTLHNLAESLDMLERNKPIKFSDSHNRSLSGSLKKEETSFVEINQPFPRTIMENRPKLSEPPQEIRQNDDESCISKSESNDSMAYVCQTGIGGSEAKPRDSSISREADVNVERAQCHTAYVPRTLRDGLLLGQCCDIKAKYMSAFYSKLATARQDFKNLYDQVCSIVKELQDVHGNAWWLDALASIECCVKQRHELVSKIRDSLLERDAMGLSRVGHENASSLALRFRDINGLRYILKRELDAIESHRSNLFDQLMKLDHIMDSPTAEIIERAANCSVCDFVQNGPPCSHCELDKLFQLYENRLFLLRSSATNVGGVVSVEDAFIAQERLRMQRRMSAVTAGVTSKDSAESFTSAQEELGRYKRTKGASEIARADVSRAPSETECILKIIKSYMKQIMGRDAVTTGKKHLQALEAMRKEYAQARMLVLAQRGVLSALDELNMAITRLCFRYPGEDVANEFKQLLKLHEEEIPERNAQLTADKFRGLEDLSRAKGQLRYLKGLTLTREKVATNQNDENDKALCTDGSASSLKERCQGPAVTSLGGSDDETCPVCHEVLGSQLMVLPCGHLLCCRCMMAILEQAPDPAGGVEQKRIMCPSCRYRTYVGDVAFVDNLSNKNIYTQTFSKLEDGEKNGEFSLPVKGSYGTKIEAVIRRILWIKSNDSSAKFLLFSTWNDVLDVVEHALSANDISYARVKGRRKLNTAICKFKGTPQYGQVSLQQKNKQNQDYPVQVLLLLIKQGANGLNLVEAQHVILIEPLLNPSDEAQAINRVHRIGQVHSTFVHRFLIKETVEESIYRLGQHKSYSQNGIPHTVVGKTNQDIFSLTINDVSMLFSADACNETLHSLACKTEKDLSTRSWKDLPPAAAAAAAAEARRNQIFKNGP